MDTTILKRIAKQVDYQAIIASKKQFTDTDFPPQESSIFNSRDSSSDREETSYFKSLQWKRVSEIFKGQDYNIFFDAIEPSDILQGQLANCYFLSALSSLAENPDRVRKLFITQTVNSSGIYVMNFCINGEFKEVVVDDYIPCNPQTGQPAFSKCHGNELWVILLEKAWAKINGSYEKTKYGLSSIAFVFLTGLPCINYDHQYIECFWEDIQKADQENYIITASSDKPELNESDLKRLGLVSAHCYSVISVHIITVGGKEVKLLRLRNPWGHQEWQGDWSDNSNKWTPALRRQLGSTIEDDGIFFISYDDYLTYYRGTTVCIYKDSYIRQTLKAKHSKNSYSLFQFTIPTSARDPSVNIMIYQIFEKMVSAPQTSAAKFECSMVRIIVGKVETNPRKKNKFPIQYIEGTTNDLFQTPLLFKEKLTPGMYILRIEIDWKLPTLNDFVVGHYSSLDIGLKEIAKTAYPNFLEHVLRSCAVQKSKRDYYPGELSQAYKCLSLDESKSHYGFYYVENNSSTVLTEKVVFTRLENYELMYPFAGTEAEVVVQPGETEIVVLKRTGPEASVQCRFQLKQKSSITDLIANAIAAGDKTQVSYQGKQYDIFYYVSDHVAGILFYFANKSKITQYNAKFTFSGENLTLVNDAGEPMSDKEFIICLEAGQACYKKLEIIDDQVSFKFSYSSSTRCADKVTNETDIKKLLKEKGQKQQISVKAEKKLIFYYVGYINDQYYWLFENQETEACEFNGTFKFKLSNLKLDSGGTEWKILLKQGESALKKMEKIDANKTGETSYECSLAFSFKQSKR